MSESIGPYLRRERELRKISLEEIATKTCIKRDYLQAIESEHYEKLPGLTFARGYLKAYAIYIGLDAEDVIFRFEDFLNRLSEFKGAERPKSRSRKLLGFILLLLFGLGMALLLWFKK